MGVTQKKSLVIYLFGGDKPIDATQYSMHPDINTSFGGSALSYTEAAALPQIQNAEEPLPSDSKKAVPGVYIARRVQQPIENREQVGGYIIVEEGKDSREKAERLLHTWVAKQEANKFSWAVYEFTAEKPVDDSHTYSNNPAVTAALKPKLLPYGRTVAFQSQNAEERLPPHPRNAFPGVYISSRESRPDNREAVRGYVVLEPGEDCHERAGKMIRNWAEDLTQEFTRLKTQRETQTQKVQEFEEIRAVMAARLEEGKTAPEVAEEEKPSGIALKRTQVEKFHARYGQHPKGAPGKLNGAPVAEEAVEAPEMEGADQGNGQQVTANGDPKAGVIAQGGNFTGKYPKRAVLKRVVDRRR